MTIMLFSIGVISRELFPQRANFLIQYSHYSVSLTTNEIEQQLFRSMTELDFFSSSLNCQKHSMWQTELEWRHQVLWGVCHILFKGWLGLLCGPCSRDFYAMTCVSICKWHQKASDWHPYPKQLLMYKVSVAGGWEGGRVLPILSVCLIDLQEGTSGRSGCSCWSPSTSGSQGTRQGWECTGIPCSEVSRRARSGRRWHGGSCSSWSA